MAKIDANAIMRQAIIIAKEDVQRSKRKNWFFIGPPWWSKYKNAQQFDPSGVV
jgi:hypothetical protein